MRKSKSVTCLGRWALIEVSSILNKSESNISYPELVCMIADRSFHYVKTWPYKCILALLKGRLPFNSKRLQNFWYVGTVGTCTVLRHSFACHVRKGATYTCDWESIGVLS